MGWTDIVGASSKVGRLILDTSLNQLHRQPPRQVSPPSEIPQSDEQFSSQPEEVYGGGGPDTSSLSAFIYSLLSPNQGEGQGEEPKGKAGSSSSQDDDSFGGSRNEGGDADWCLVSTSGELGYSLMEEYMITPACTPRLPGMNDESCLLSENFRKVLYPLLPTIVKDCQWVLLYSTARDGISLTTLYRKSAALPGPCLLVAGDTKGAVFGGLLLAPLKPARNRYQGSNQTFVFTDVSGVPKVFRSTGLNRYFFLCTNEALAIGGGGHFALHLESDLLTGSSGACETFGSGCLAHSDEFDLKDVELWGFSYGAKRRR